MSALETLSASAGQAGNTIIYIYIRQEALWRDFVLNAVILLPIEVIDRELRPFCTLR